MQVPYHFVPLPTFLLPRVHEMTKATLAVVLVICSKTIPWGKKSDVISYSQFAEATGLCLQAIADGIHLAMELGVIHRWIVGNSYSYQLLIPKEERREKPAPSERPQSAPRTIETQQNDDSDDDKGEGEVMATLESINNEARRAGAPPLQNLPWLARRARRLGMKGADLLCLWKSCKAAKGARKPLGLLLWALRGDGRITRGKGKGGAGKRRTGVYREVEEVLRVS